MVASYRRLLLKIFSRSDLALGPEELPEVLTLQEIIGSISPEQLTRDLATGEQKDDPNDPAHFVLVHRAVGNFFLNIAYIKGTDNPRDLCIMVQNRYILPVVHHFHTTIDEGDTPRNLTFKTLEVIAKLELTHAQQQLSQFKQLGLYLA